MPDPEPSPAATPPLRQAGAVNVLMFAVMSVAATVFGFSALLADIAADFHVGVAQAARLPGVYSATLAVVAPAVGLLGQRWPRDRVIIGGLAVYAAAWGLASVAPSLGMLLALAALAGGATGAVLPASYARAADIAGPGEQARVMARVVTGWSLAILVMVPVMSALAQLGSWRWAFGALAACALVPAVVMLRGARGAAPGASSASTASAAAMTSAVPPSPASQSLAAAVRASLSTVLRDRPTMIVIAANMIDMGAFYAVFTFIAAEVRRLTGVPGAVAGALLAAYGVGLAIAGANGARIDRIGRKRVAVTALAVLAAWLMVLPWLAHWPWAIAPGVLLWGAVQGSFFTSITTLATLQLPAHRGVVTSLLGGSTYLGVSLYTPVSTWLYANAGFWAVGVAAGVGTLGAAVLLARLPAGRG